MPAMDRTGPFGTGPVGRGMGRCRGGEGAGQAQGGGRGRGRRGRGHGNGECFGGGWSGTSPVTADDEAAQLEKRISALQTRVKALRTGNTD